MQEENQNSLQRNQEQESEGNKQGERRTMDTLFFSKNFIEVWLIFSVALRSAAQQCDSVIHIQKYIFFFLFFFMWFMTG